MTTVEYLEVVFRICFALFAGGGTVIGIIWIAKQVLK